MDRRGFLGSILAACVAPAIVRADSLMRIIPRETSILLNYDEWCLTEIQRRGLMPRLVVQIYNQSPLISALIANAKPELSEPMPMHVALGTRPSPLFKRIMRP